ncbi:hypothetical protein EVAR_96293_1 [Eumeta japonica]|uniref:Uncharacterized protein n=1 Tax=Eumeta variegata TaxID=151549 RepID=A0A4C1VYZ1_EUMVA|nr:hypothetical protein EVAR_96293_1 [Eumeta japonica]
MSIWKDRASTRDDGLLQHVHAVPGWRDFLTQSEGSFGIMLAVQEFHRRIDQDLLIDLVRSRSTRRKPRSAPGHGRPPAARPPRPRRSRNSARERLVSPIDSLMSRRYGISAYETL